MTNGQHPPRHEAKATAKDRLLQTIAILGLIAILLLGAWGIIQLAFNLPGIFSSVGSSISGMFRTASSTQAVKESMTVTAPQSITNEQPFTLTWRHTLSGGQYGYTVSYSCVDGISMKAPLPTGSYQAVECGKPFNFTNATQKMTLIPTVTANDARVTFTVSAVKLSNKQVSVSGTASANAKTKEVTTATKTTTSTTGATYYGSGRTSNLYGYPDLVVQINSINSLSSSFGRTAVVFTIQNAGTNVALAGWTFDAFLPVNNGFLYSSPLQQPLYPGDRIVYTLTFDEGDYDRDYRNYRHDDYDNYGGITITVDPRNQVYEASEFNNTASAY